MGQMQYVKRKMRKYVKARCGALQKAMRKYKLYKGEYGISSGFPTRLTVNTPESKQQSRDMKNGGRGMKRIIPRKSPGESHQMPRLLKRLKNNESSEVIMSKEIWRHGTPPESEGGDTAPRRVPFRRLHVESKGRPRDMCK